MTGGTVTGVAHQRRLTFIQTMIDNDLNLSETAKKLNITLAAATTKWGRLSKRPEVIEMLETKAAKTPLITKQNALLHMEGFVFDKTNPPSVRLRALELMCRIYGLLDSAQQEAVRPPPNVQIVLKE